MYISFVLGLIANAEEKKLLAEYGLIGPHLTHYTQRSEGMSSISKKSVSPHNDSFPFEPKGASETIVAGKSGASEGLAAQSKAAFPQGETNLFITHI